MKTSRSITKIIPTALAFILFLTLAGSLFSSTAMAMTGDPEQQDHLESLLWNYCISAGGTPSAHYENGNTTVFCTLPGNKHFICTLYPSGNSACVQYFVLDEGLFGQTAPAKDLTTHLPPRD